MALLSSIGDDESEDDLRPALLRMAIHARGPGKLLSGISRIADSMEWVAMQPELTPVHIGESDADDSISAVADLYFANLDMRDPDLLRRAYEVVGSVPEEFNDLYADAAGLGHRD